MLLGSPTPVEKMLSLQWDTIPDNKLVEPKLTHKRQLSTLIIRSLRESGSHTITLSCGALMPHNMPRAMARRGGAIGVRKPPPNNLSPCVLEAAWQGAHWLDRPPSGRQAPFSARHCSGIDTPP